MPPGIGSMVEWLGALLQTGLQRAGLAPAVAVQDGDEEAGSSSDSRRRRGQASLRATLAASAAGAVCIGAAVTLVVLGRRRRRRGPADRPLGRIPLKDVIRFKERQWFVEELENSRDGDANAMLRLAKMYLHGQGCQRNIAMAQEWLKKARYAGVGGTLDELFATDDPEPRSRLRELMALEERRRAMMRKAGGAQGQPVYPEHAQWRS